MKRIADFLWAPGPPRIVYILLGVLLIFQIVMTARMTRLNQRILKTNEDCIGILNRAMALRSKNVI